MSDLIAINSRLPPLRYQAYPDMTVQQLLPGQLPLLFWGPLQQRLVARPPEFYLPVELTVNQDTDEAVTRLLAAELEMYQLITRRLGHPNWQLSLPALGWRRTYYGQVGDGKSRRLGHSTGTPTVFGGTNILTFFLTLALCGELADHSGVLALVSPTDCQPLITLTPPPGHI